jgi:hypothetical protein
MLCSNSWRGSWSCDEGGLGAPGRRERQPKMRNTCSMSTFRSLPRTFPITPTASARTIEGSSANGRNNLLLISRARQPTKGSASLVAEIVCLGKRSPLGWLWLVLLSLVPVNKTFILCMLEAIDIVTLELKVAQSGPVQTRRTVRESLPRSDVLEARRPGPRRSLHPP